MFLAGLNVSLDGRGALAHVRLDVLNALDGNHRCSIGLTISVSITSGRADPARGNGQHRLRCFRELAHAEMKEADHAEKHQRRHEHPGEYRTSNREIGEGHGRGWVALTEQRKDGIGFGGIQRQDYNFIRLRTRSLVKPFVIPFIPLFRQS